MEPHSDPIEPHRALWVAVPPHGRPHTALECALFCSLKLYSYVKKNRSRRWGAGRKADGGKERRGEERKGKGGDIFFRFRLGEEKSSSVSGLEGEGSGGREGGETDFRFRLGFARRGAWPREGAGLWLGAKSFPEGGGRGERWKIGRAHV